jgi:DNA recombination protein RmuC
MSPPDAKATSRPSGEMPGSANAGPVDGPCAARPPANMLTTSAVTRELLDMREASHRVTANSIARGESALISFTLAILELAVIAVVALAAGFAAGWLLASRQHSSQQDQMREAFEALAASTLKTTTDEFLKLADQKIGNVHREAAIDLTRRQQELGTLVSPIKDTLQQVDAKLKEVEKSRVDDSANMRSLLGLVGHTQQQLQQETQNLVRALRSPGVRGQWGEVQLRKVVELSGMLDHCDFDEQPTIFADGGRMRPDMIINLPGGRTIVVDAKAPLEAFLDAQAATEDGIRSGKLADHVRQVKEHVRKLGEKSYWDALPGSPEVVILFLPAEAIYMAALERDSTLIDFSVRQKVLIASPLTLIALLRSAAYGWNQQRLTINAEEISRLGRALHESVATMAEHLEDLRKRMDGSFSTFNKLVGSFENNVFVKARRFRELGAGSVKEVPVVEPLETVARKIDLPVQQGLLESEEARATSGDRS